MKPYGNVIGWAVYRRVDAAWESGAHVVERLDSNSNRRTFRASSQNHGAEALLEQSQTLIRRMGDHPA